MSIKTYVDSVTGGMTWLEAVNSLADIPDETFNGQFQVFINPCKATVIWLPEEKKCVQFSGAVDATQEMDDLLNKEMLQCNRRFDSNEPLRKIIEKL